MNRIKSFSLFWLVLAPLLVGTQNFAFAQPDEKVNLKGYVKDEKSGETLPYANISVKGTKYGTTSNVNGYFVLVDVPVGLCTLRVSYIGYEAVELPVQAKKALAALTVNMYPFGETHLEVEGEMTYIGERDFPTGAASSVATTRRRACEDDQRCGRARL